MELNEKCEIKILNIESPGKFRFRTMRNHKKTKNSLNFYLQGNDIESNYVPTMNELIIAKLSRKYYVGNVENVMDDGKIVISLIETGRTMQISCANVIQLKDEALANGIKNSILMGSIGGILPAQAVRITKHVSTDILYITKILYTKKYI